MDVAPPGLNNLSNRYPGFSCRFRGSAHPGLADITPPGRRKHKLEKKHLYHIPEGLRTSPLRGLENKIRGKEPLPKHICKPRVSNAAEAASEPWVWLKRH